MSRRSRARATHKHWRRQIATSTSAVSLALLGLTGLEPPSASATFINSGAHSTAQVGAVSSEANTAISFNLFELLGNVFRYIQVSNISDEEEVVLGRQINDMLLSQQYQLYGNDQVQSYVSRVGQRLVNESDSREIPFNFQVVDSEEINAFAIPGGYVYVTTGLLQTAENEAQLASVLAHEISHINKRHSVEALKRATLAQGIAETANIETSQLAQIGYQLAIDLPRSRDFEYAADEGGLRILQQSGYPTMAFINFLEKLESASVTPEFLRTHPTSANRIRELREQIATRDDANDLGVREDSYQDATYPLN